MLVGQARDRLVVRDPAGAHGVLLARGEAEEELRRVGDQLRARDAGGHRHLLRQALLPLEAAADEAAPDAGRGEESAEVVEERLRPGPDVLGVVAAEEDGDLVLLEDELLGIAREADRVDQRARRPSPRLGRPEVHGQVLLGEGRDVAAEVRKAPRDGDVQAARLRRELVLEAKERGLELVASLPQRRGRLVDPDGRGDDLVVERRHEHLDAVVDHLVERDDVLLGAGGAPPRKPAGLLAEAVDELVDPGAAERDAERRARAAHHELAAGQLHRRRLRPSARPGRGRP